MLYAILCYDSEDVVECASLEEAIETAKELGRASSSNGAYEIRPIALFKPGSGGVEN
jgi:hypothetical protein